MEASEAEIVDALRRHGALFAFVHGSRADGSVRPDSDLDIAAFFRAPAPAAFDVLLPPNTDLLVLNDAPLELAGRVALEGRLLFDDDQVRRVNWTAQTRKIYSDEQPRMLRAHREFAESLRARG